ncbi:MAG TPA: hypothetical protein VJV39_24440 [Dongiaceae bacterium]|nr:hypothetical protein [Dongiaceae bacterium]
MKNWHLMIVGLLALVVAVLVGLNWTAGSGTADRESKQEKVKVKAEQPAGKPKKKDSAIRNFVEKQCKKFLAERVADADEGDIEDTCACAADDIHAEFGDELLDMMKSNNLDPETEARADAMIQECAAQAGLEP